MKINQRFGEILASIFRVEEQETSMEKAAYSLSACFMLVSCLAYSSTLKMEATCSSEMSVGFYPTTIHISQNTEISIPPL
jgi:hypothetical protein